MNDTITFYLITQHVYIVSDVFYTTNPHLMYEFFNQYDITEFEYDVYEARNVKEFFAMVKDDKNIVMYEQYELRVHGSWDGRYRIVTSDDYINSIDIYSQSDYMLKNSVKAWYNLSKLREYVRPEVTEMFSRIMSKLYIYVLRYVTMETIEFDNLYPDIKRLLCLEDELDYVPCEIIDEDAILAIIELGEDG